MITAETASRIWNCYREIAAGKKLLKDMAEAQRENSGQDDPKYAETLRDAFGRRRKLQLGIPSGDACHRLLDVEPQLGKSIIRAHIANKIAELAEANEQARIELNSPQEPIVGPGEFLNSHDEE